MKISKSAAKQSNAAKATGASTTRPHTPWTDFHIVLTIAREGSVAKACKALLMTHSTLLRKLDQIETHLNARLFDRVRGRYTLTAAGHEIEQAARAFEPIAQTAEARAMGQDRKPSGEVRVSVTSLVLHHLLPPVLIQFASAFPEIQLEFATSLEHVSLRRREADVAIRVSDAVPDWLVGRKLADLQFKIYERRHGRVNVPLRANEALARERRWISFESDVHDLKFNRWLAATVPAENVIMRVGNFNQALTMVRAGLGIALLPAFLERFAPDLQPLTRPIAKLKTPLWLITHPELRNTTRIQVIMHAFAPAIENAVRAIQNES